HSAPSALQTLPLHDALPICIGDYGLIAGEMVTGVLADEILTPGPGQIRFLLNHGGNPAQAVPDQRKMTRALESLELMVSIEPHIDRKSTRLNSSHVKISYAV